MKVITSLLLISTTLFSTTLYGYGQQPKPKTPIYFICSCEDAIGSRYATALRDLVAASPRYQEANKAEELGADGKTVTKYNWAIDVVSIDIDAPSQTGHESALAVVIKIGNSVYWTHWIQICGSAKAADCAATTLADFDNEVQKIR